MVTSMPVGLIYSVRAARKAEDRAFSWIALSLSLIAWTFTATALAIKFLGP